jgi:hypothetical protein
VDENSATLIPTTSPLILIRGPPLLPGFIGTSVTITSRISNWERIEEESSMSDSNEDGRSAPSLPTTPSVNTKENSKGLPITATCSPTLKAVELPIGNGISLSFGTSFA